MVRLISSKVEQKIHGKERIERACFVHRTNVRLGELHLEMLFHGFNVGNCLNADDWYDIGSLSI